ncbi:MAG: rhomboid family intramembrane serine protease, partial [Cytophagales bacterium]|nr:rhomboid family intramembrane serine protease [Cytophagales bacterium]
MFNQLTPAVKTLLLANLAIFLLCIVTFNSTGIDINDIFGLRYIGSSHFQPYQFVTYMFLHAYLGAMGGLSFGHIFSNMFALFMFGPMLESFWGTKRFLIFYMATGIGAGLINSGVTFYEKYQMKVAVEQYVANPTPDNMAAFLRNHSNTYVYERVLDFVNTFEVHKNDPGLIQQSMEIVRQFYDPDRGVTVGASGAIFGILIAFGMLFPNTEMLILLIPFPIKAKYLVGFYALYEIYAGVEKAAGDNVDHFAH